MLKTQFIFSRSRGRTLLIDLYSETNSGTWHAIPPQPSAATTTSATGVAGAGITCDPGNGQQRE